MNLEEACQEIEKLQSIIRSFSARIDAQSDILTQLAEKDAASSALDAWHKEHTFPDTYALAHSTPGYAGWMVCLRSGDRYVIVDGTDAAKVDPKSDRVFNIGEPGKPASFLLAVQTALLHWKRLYGEG